MVTSAFAWTVDDQKSGLGQKPHRKNGILYPYIKTPTLLKFEVFDMVAAKSLNSPLSVSCEEIVDRFSVSRLRPVVG